LSDLASGWFASAVVTLCFGVVQQDALFQRIVSLRSARLRVLFGKQVFQCKTLWRHGEASNQALQPTATRLVNLALPDYKTQ